MVCALKKWLRTQTRTIEAQTMDTTFTPEPHMGGARDMQLRFACGERKRNYLKIENIIFHLTPIGKRAQNSYVSLYKSVSIEPFKSIWRYSILSAVIGAQ